MPKTGYTVEEETTTWYVCQGQAPNANGGTPCGYKSQYLDDISGHIDRRHPPTGIERLRAECDRALAATRAAGVEFGPPHIMLTADQFDRLLKVVETAIAREKFASRFSRAGQDGWDTYVQYVLSGRTDQGVYGSGVRDVIQALVNLDG